MFKKNISSHLQASSRKATPLFSVFLALVLQLSWPISALAFDSPDNTVTVTAEKTKALVGASIAAFNIRKNQDWDAYGKMVIVDQLLKANPELKSTPDALMQAVSNEWAKNSGQGLLLYDRIVKTSNGIGATLATLPNMGADFKVGVGFAEGVINAISPKIPAGLESSTANQYAEKSEVYRKLRTGVQGFSESTIDLDSAMNDIFGRYSGDLIGQKVFNQMLGNSWGVSIGQIADQALRKNPSFKDLVGIKLPNEGVGALTLNAKGELITTVQKAKTIAIATFPKIQGVIRDAKADLNSDEVKAKLTNIITYVQDIDQADIDAAARRGTAYLTTLNGAQSTVNFLSTVIGDVGGDPKLSKQISIVGNAAIKVADGLARISAAPDLKKIGSALLTGNMLGAAVDLLSVFSGGVLGNEESPDEVILGEIQNVREDIANLRTEMEERFNHIDAELSAINKNVVLSIELLQDIKINLEEIKTTLNTLQDTLYQQSTDLAGVERDIWRVIGEAALLSYTDDMYYVLGYWEEKNNPVHYDSFVPNYTLTASNFAKLAFENSTLELFSGPKERSYDDSSLLYELTEHVSSDCENDIWGVQSGGRQSGGRCQLGTSINFLSAYPAQKLSLPSLHSGNLPSISIWKLGAEAFLQLATENPWFFATDSSSHLQEIIATGCSLKQAMQSLSTPSENTLAQQSVNYPGECPAAPSRSAVYEKLINETDDGLYDTIVTQLFKDIEGVKNTFKAKYPDLDGVNIFNSVTQDTDAKPDKINIKFYRPDGSLRAELEPQPSVFNNLPSPFRLAWKLNPIPDGPLQATLPDMGVFTTTDEIKTCPVDGLVAAYNFNEFELNGYPDNWWYTFADVSGHGNDGMFDPINSQPLAYEVFTSRPDSFTSLYFYEAYYDLKIPYPQNDSLDLKEGMTLEVWFNPSETDNDSNIIERLDASETSSKSVYLLGFSADGIYAALLLENGQRAIVRHQVSVTPGNWYHLAATYDGTHLRLYFNGNEVENIVASGPIRASYGPLKVGGRLSSGGFVGWIDDARIYNHALKSDEIKNDMNAPVFSDCKVLLSGDWASVKKRTYGKVNIRYHIDYDHTPIEYAKVLSDRMLMSTTYQTSSGVVWLTETNPVLSDLQSFVVSNWTSGQKLRDRPAEVVYDSETWMYVNVLADLEKSFENYQKLMVTEIFGDTENNNILCTQIPNTDPVRNDVCKLNGIKVLLQDYVALGMPRSLKENDYLRSLLFGDQSIFDGDALVQAYGSAIGQAGSEPNTELVKTRSVALSQVIIGILQDINDKKFSETYPVVDETLDKLRLRLNSRLKLAANDVYEVVCKKDALGKVVCPSLTVSAEQGILKNDSKVPNIFYFDNNQQLNVDPAKLIINQVKNTEIGTLTLGQKGDFTYTPNCSASGACYAGLDSFTYNLEANIASAGPTKSDDATVTINVIKPGDLSGDGKVDTDDVNMMMDMIKRSIYNGRADLNNDKAVNVLDARQLVLLCTKPVCAR